MLKKSLQDNNVQTLPQKGNEITAPGKKGKVSAIIITQEGQATVLLPSACIAPYPDVYNKYLFLCTRA